jgi:hypothetical protein
VTARDRTVLLAVVTLAVVAAFWFGILAPKRKDAQALGAQVTVAQQRLDAANATASNAAAARARYDSDYATVARLGKAVPVEDDVPSLVYQLESTAHDHHIDFRSIKLDAQTGAAAPSSNAAAAVASANGTTPAAATSASAATLPPGATVGAAGFPTMPFDFTFDGGFFNMENFIRSLDALTTMSTNGKTISVKGRLLTVDGVALKASRKGFPSVSASVSATAYLLPSDQGLTAGATSTSPAGATPPSTSSSAAPTTSAAATSLAGGAK